MTCVAYIVERRKGRTTKKKVSWSSKLEEVKEFTMLEGEYEMSGK
jgi:hypothetical protein